MTRAPDETVRDCLAGLDPAARTDFVAAVYAARGWAVDRASDGLRATPPGADRPRRLVVRGDGATVTVTVHGDGVRTLDATDLGRMVWYALDEASRQRLCRAFFDRDPETLAAPATGTVSSEDEGGDGGGDGDAKADDSTDPHPRPESVGDEGGDGDATVGERDRIGDRRSDAGEQSNGAPDRPPTDRSDRSEWLGRAAVVGLALSLALGGIVTATGSGGVGVGSPAAAVFGGNDTADEASTATFPRGMAETGVTDASALADAHEAVLSNHSYRLTITYREFEDGKLRGVAHERALVASPDRYRSRVRRLGSLEHEAGVVASASAYANGSTGYVRTADGVRRRTEIRSPLVPTSADTIDFVDRTERTVEWYLSANDTRIVGQTVRNGTTTYRVAFEGDPWPASRNVTGRPESTRTDWFANSTGSSPRPATRASGSK